MIKQFECQHSTTVKTVQSDNAGELTSNWFEKGLADLGIKHTIVPEERRNIGGKIKEQAKEGYLVGYMNQSNQYCFWIPSQHCVTVSWDYRPHLATPRVQDISVESPVPKDKGKDMRPLTTAELHKKISQPIPLSTGTILPGI